MRPLGSDNFDVDDEKMLFISLLDFRLSDEIGSDGRARLARGSPFSTISLMSTSFTEHSLVALDDAAVGGGVVVVRARERGGDVAFRRFSCETIASTSSSSLNT